MFLNKILLENCRILTKKTFVFDKKIIIFLGDNATGKTTALEGIFLLSCTKSPRTSMPLELIQTQKEYLTVEGSVNKGQNELNLFVSLSESGKKVRKNQSYLSKISDYIGLFDVVFFQPSDTNYFSLSPQNRRNYFDTIFCQISKDYMKVLSLYKKLLKQRNLALKEATFQNNRNNMIYIEMLTKQLSEEGIKLIEYRKKFLDEINNGLDSIHYHFNSDETLKINYEPDSKKDNLFDEIMNNFKFDCESKHTNKGPHRDDYIFIINNKNMFSYCSQGQQKSAILSFKIAVLNLFKKIKGEWPVLILDDALGELDKKRQNALFEILDKDVQMFLSATSLKGINNEIIEDSQIIEINKGVDINER